MGLFDDDNQDNYDYLDGDGGNGGDSNNPLMHLGLFKFLFGLIGKFTNLFGGTDDIDD